MADRTKITWADATWSPVSGCTKVSAGCANCYISRTPPFRKAHRRFERVGNSMTTGVQLHSNRLDQPLHWRRPRHIFVCSMSDLFHEDVPDQFIASCFEKMYKAPQHQFQVLTKRPGRMKAFFDHMNPRWPFVPWPLPNVWLGVSVENQYWADQRIPLLLQTPAAVRFLSLEPLLKPVNLTLEISEWPEPKDIATLDTLRGAMRIDGRNEPSFGAKVDWVIVGGESGPKRRPMKEAWVRLLRDQCVAAGIPFFLKQWGGARPGGEALLDGRPWREWPVPILAGQYGSEDKP